MKHIKVEERHLGLVPAIERENILQSIEKWGELWLKMWI